MSFIDREKILTLTLLTGRNPNPNPNPNTFWWENVDTVYGKLWLADSIPVNKPLDKAIDRDLPVNS